MPGIPPQVIGGLISGVGSIAGGIAGKRKSKVPKFNPQPLIQEVQRGSKAARDTIAGIRREVKPIDQELQRSISEIGAGGADTRRKTANAFLENLGRGEAAARLKKSNLLQQQIAQSQPEQIRQIEEAGAATGGVRRGAVTTAVQQRLAENNNAKNQLNAALDIGSQEAINTALNTVFQTDVGAQLRQQGVDEDTARFLAETGRADVIRELASIADIEQNKSLNIADLLQATNEADAARALAQAQQKGGLLQSIIGGGSNLVGQVFASGGGK